MRRRAHRNNGDIATVRTVDPQGTSVLVEKDDGSQQMLDLSRLADRHLRHGWVRTIHSAQGATADRVMAHMESFRANTVDAASAYVAISRARDGVALYTDSRVRLTDALGLRDGAQVGAIDQTMSGKQAPHSTDRSKTSNTVPSSHRIEICFFCITPAEVRNPYKESYPLLFCEALPVRTSIFKQQSIASVTRYLE